jgi:O-antigen ligase
MIAPRGSREGAWSRLSHAGTTGLFLFLLGLVLLSTVLVGFLAGPLLSVPFGLGLLLTGIPAARGTGLRWAAPGLTALALGGIGLGIGAGRIVDRPPGTSLLASREGVAPVAEVWRDASRIARAFPWLGAGMGSFASIYPSYKTQDKATTTALSSLLQWWVEAGLAGLALAVLGAAWCLVRLPRALGRVGTADRALAFGLVGSLACFATFSVVHWTVELMAVALAACAFGGTVNRWLAGGTDLFVEPA